MKKPILIITLGYPGSGKTYFAERLAKKFKCLHINSDRTRYTVFKNPTFSPEETLSVFNIMESIAKEALQKGISVICDGNMNFKTRRKPFQKVAKQCGASYHIVWIQTDISTAEKRLMQLSKAKRKNLLYPPIELWVLHKLKNEIEKPTKSEPVVVIDGHAPFSNQLQQLKREISL
jgi:predicted kinase